MSRGRTLRTVGWGGAGLLLLLPAVAMRFSQDVRWTASDFVFAGVLFGAAGLGAELVARRTTSLAYRAGAGLALLTGLLLVWVNAAVGIIGGEHQVANLVFPLVVLVALGGAVLARFGARGMATAMAVAALAQALTPAVAWLVWPEVRSDLSPKVLGLIGAFGLLWVVSGALFRPRG